MAAHNLNLTFANRLPNANELEILNNMTKIVQAANELGIMLFGGAVRDLQVGQLPKDLDFITPDEFPKEFAQKLYESRKYHGMSMGQKISKCRDFEMSTAFENFRWSLSNEFEVHRLFGLYSEYPQDKDVFRVEITKDNSFSITADFVSERLFESSLDVNVNGLYYDIDGKLCCRSDLNLKQILDDCKEKQFRIIQKGESYDISKCEHLIADIRQIYDPLQRDVRLVKILSRGWSWINGDNKYNKSQSSALLTALRSNNHLSLAGVETSPDQESLLQIPSKKLCLICQKTFEDDIFVFRLQCCKEEVHSRCILEKLNHSYIDNHNEVFSCRDLKCKGDPFSWKTGGPIFRDTINCYLNRFGFISFNETQYPISFTKDFKKYLLVIIGDDKIVHREFIKVKTLMYELFSVLLRKFLEQLNSDKYCKDGMYVGNFTDDPIDAGHVFYFYLIQCNDRYNVLHHITRADDNIGTNFQYEHGYWYRKYFCSSIDIERYKDDAMKDLI